MFERTKELAIRIAPPPVVNVARRVVLRRIVRIDRAHAELLRTLVMAGKPRDILEFGFGAGESAAAILSGARFNRMPFSYTLVDNWMDFDGVQPQMTTRRGFRDVRCFRNLGEILDLVRERGYRHALFDRSSRRGERCERGLLVIFKDPVSPAG